MDITIKDLPNDLRNRLKEAGLFRYTYRYYVVFSSVLLVGLIAAYTLLLYVETLWQVLLVGFVLAIMSGQFGFLGHDFSHRQVCVSERIRIFGGEIIWGFILGMSMLWWEDDHNQHHQETNKINHDTQINSQFVFSAKQLPYAGSFQKKWILPIQHWLFLPFSAFMYISIALSSFHFVLRALIEKPFRLRMLAELLLMTLHYILMFSFVFWTLGFWYGVLVLLLVYFVGGLATGLAFAPNHKGELILGEDEEVNFLTQIEATRNIQPSWFNDLILGSLNYQIEHHLFSRLPRPLLPKARVIVKQYCQEKGITYHETSLLGSYLAIVKSLRENARLAKAV